MSKNLSSRLLVCALLSCLSARAAAGLSPILQGYWYPVPNLEFGNGNKVANARFNHLFAVAATQDPSLPISDIFFVDMVYDNSSNNTSGDPYVWTQTQLSFDGASSQPALAVDTTSGLAVAVWVAKPCAANPLGGIYYSYQYGSYQGGVYWSQPRQIVFQGAEPSVVAAGGVAHIAWTTGDRAEYTSFPTQSPPGLPLWMGEVVDFANCPGTHFHQPSIALAQPPCQTLDVRIAALLSSNEQGTAGTCHLSFTQSGPRVYQRDVNTQGWSTVFQEVTNDTAQNQPDPAAHSISLNANRITGDFYLAWSDEQNQSARTRVGHGKGANWDPSQAIDPLAHHVHVAAQGGGAAGKFRLALSDTSWGTGAYTQTGKWNGGVTWTGPAVTLPDSNYPLIANPQATYWRRCSAGHLQEIKSYSAGSDWSPNGLKDLLIDPTDTSPVNCFVISAGDAIPFPNCYQSHLLLAQMAPGSGDGVLVDFDGTIASATVSETGAKLTTLSGGTIQATWAPGTVLYTWDSGFAVATRRDSVRFSSDDARFSVEDAGVLSPPAKPAGKK